MSKRNRIIVAIMLIAVGLIALGLTLALWGPDKTPSDPNNHHIALFGALIPLYAVPIIIAARRRREKNKNG